MSEELEKPVKSKKAELSELISVMKSDMEKIQTIGLGLASRCDDMLTLLKDLSDPSISAPKENHYPNYVT